MRSRMILLPLLALAVGLYFWQTAPDTDVPACTWRIGTGTEIRQGRNFEELDPETPIRLSVVCQVPRHVYVFSHSAEDGTLLLFPSPAIDADVSNPLPAGRSVLPGRRGDQEVAWTTRNAILATTTFFAVAAREPIAELEELLPRLRYWTNTVFPDRGMAVTKPGGDVEVTGGSRAGIPSPLLRLAADVGNTDENPNGPMKPAPGYEGVFTSSWKIREKKSAGAGARPGGEGKGK